MRQQPIPSDDDRLMSDEFLEHKDREWRDRAHFFAIPGRAIRWRPINMGCRKPVTYVPVEELEAPSVNLELAIDIDRLLDELAATHPGLVHGGSDEMLFGTYRPRGGRSTGHAAAHLATLVAPRPELAA
jgi:hypothetical protein